jgi:hypothetical protein
MIDDDITPKPGVVCLVPLDRLVLLPSAYIAAVKIARLLTFMSDAKRSCGGLEDRGR